MWDLEPPDLSVWKKASKNLQYTEQQQVEGDPEKESEKRFCDNLENKGDALTDYTNNLKYLEQWRFICIDFAKYREANRDLLKGKIRRGIPDCLRGYVWQKLAGNHELKAELTTNLYANLCNSKIAPCQSDIIRDISRTFPKHTFFREKYSVGQESLYNVLRSYSIYNSEVGYCQGMGFITGILLMYMDEEDAFFMLINILSKYSMEGLFLPGLPLLDKYLFELRSLIIEYLPNLHSHFQKENVEETMYASQWFMTLFAYSFNFDSIIRIWDVFFDEGIYVVFRGALAILKILEKDLYSKNFEAILECLKNAHLHVSPSQLIKMILSIKLPKRFLQNMDRKNL